MIPRVSVLDCGYLQGIETWGSDERIIEAARMSTGRGFLSWEAGETCVRCGVNRPSSGSDVIGCPRSDHEAHSYEQHNGDARLLKFLWSNAHHTPFEMAGLVLEVQAPIFVFREWHRHRTQSYNEMSARYTPLPDVNYVPSVERLLLNSKTNKQAGTVKGSAELDERNAEHFRKELVHQYSEAEDLYQWALISGVPKELARVHLPVGRYSRMRASANLRNWLAFLTLREAPSAQWEIRQYAHALHSVLAVAFPRTLALFSEKLP